MSQDTNIITVTLAPSLDRTLITRHLSIGYENRFAKLGSLDPAGRGINVSRALHRLGAQTTALILLGNDVTARAYNALIQEEGFDVLAVRTDGRTRNRLIILDEGTDTETQIIEESSEVDADDIAAVGQLIQEMAQPHDLVLLAGRLPNGVAEDTYAYLTDCAQEAGANAALFDVGRLEDAELEAGPELVILSNTDAEAHFNYPIRTQKDLLGAAHKLHHSGAQHVLIVERQHDFAILFNGAHSWILEFPHNGKGTSSGIWDALAAGFLVSHTFLDADPTHALSLAGAAALYTINHIGNDFGTRQEIEAHIDELRINTLDPEATE